MVGVDSREISRVSRYSGDLLIKSLTLSYGPFTLFEALSQVLHLVKLFIYAIPTTPRINSWFGLLRFRSPLLAESHSLYFPAVTEMFHFSAFSALTLQLRRSFT